MTIMFVLATSVLLLSSLFVARAEYKTPPATYEAKVFTAWAKERVLDKAGSGAVSRKAQIHVSLAEDGSDSV